MFRPAQALFRLPVPAHGSPQWSAGHPPLTDVLSGVLPDHRMPTQPAGQSNRWNVLRGAKGSGNGHFHPSFTGLASTGGLHGLVQDGSQEAR